MNSLTSKLLPDLIVMDMNMPKVSGLEALKSLKSNPETQHIPVVMLSTSHDQKLITRAYDAGVSAYVTKPTSIHDYKRIIESLNLSFLNNYSCEENFTDTKVFANKSILVIEDNDDHWELMKHTIGQSVPEVKLVRLDNKDSTLDFLTDTWNTMENPPGLIILDLYLPGSRDGLNLLDSIRYFFRIHRLPLVPVIVFSSSNDKEDIKASYRHNANAYMIKTMDTANSFSFLQNLCTFWWQTISLPVVK
jgi:CheY-like chemotaxis protein